MDEECELRTQSSTRKDEFALTTYDIRQIKYDCLWYLVVVLEDLLADFSKRQIIPKNVMFVTLSRTMYGIKSFNPTAENPVVLSHTRLFVVDS